MQSNPGQPGVTSYHRVRGEESKQKNSTEERTNHPLCFVLLRKKDTELDPLAILGPKGKMPCLLYGVCMCSLLENLV